MTDFTQGGPSGEGGDLLPSLANVRRLSYAELELLSAQGDAWATAELVLRDKRWAEKASKPVGESKLAIPSEGPALRAFEAAHSTLAAPAAPTLRAASSLPPDWPIAALVANDRARERVRRGITPLKWTEIGEAVDKAFDRAAGIEDNDETKAALAEDGWEQWAEQLAESGAKEEEAEREMEAARAYLAKQDAAKANAKDTEALRVSDIVEEVAKHVPASELDERGKPRVWPRPPKGWQMWTDYVREKRRGVPPGWVSWEKYEIARARAAEYRDARTLPAVKQVDKAKGKGEEVLPLSSVEVAPNGAVVIHPAIAPQRNYQLKVTPHTNKMVGHLAPLGFEYVSTSASWTMLVHIASGALWDWKTGTGLVRAGMLTSKGAVLPQKGAAPMGRDNEEDSNNEALAEAIIAAQLKAAGIPVPNEATPGLYTVKSIPQKSFECHKSPSLVYDLGSLRIWGSKGSAHDRIGSPDWALRLICLEDLGKYDIPDAPVVINDRAHRLGFAPVAVPSPAWVHIRWPDYGTPGLTAAWWQRFASQLRNIEGDVVVYCFGGHGRTGTALTILGCLLDAIPLNVCPVAWLRRNYCQSVVESEEQCAYIERVTGREVNSGPRDYGFTYTSRGPNKYVEGYKAPEKAEKELDQLHGHSRGQRKGKRRRNKKRRAAKLKQPGMRWA